MVLAIFTILSFVIIFTVRQTYKDKEIPGATTEEQTETNARTRTNTRTRTTQTEQNQHPNQNHN